MSRPPLARRCWPGVLALSLSFTAATGCPAPRRSTLAAKWTAACRPTCASSDTCHGLDDKLVAARAPMLRCVHQASRHGRLDQAHRCYRALRLLESARWWLRTLDGEDAVLPTVYRAPVETVRTVFQCRIERLSRAQTPEQVERLYLEMIRAFP